MGKYERTTGDGVFELKETEFSSYRNSSYTSNG